LRLWSAGGELGAYQVLRGRPGDTFVVWKLDRAGRSLTHLIEFLKGLKERNIEFIRAF
jgi:DNA invertase Pin-like site-specific DNA recombinase